ncbi:MULTISPECIES: Bax inhibitor-1/YccA family protein [Weissella]|jgi:Integral membrane protein, interacts with FtsH|uniref:BAX inhibitor (BI)-1/YccA family protein n=3 Tax=Weissella TaxID=46255 RepID=A0A1T4J711_WEICO|nr:MULTISPECIES: Bax inhibitor-1/YccA family protein [Weissella]COI36149.1 integral membrane protein [Streptococcus pneumoniae]MBJ7615889.1 Bax inhibitor-1/YccA family protein [Weissella confusa]MBJ7624132.1 Bax inhibitor-1/YccA family protein [Weissella confusa]MBJ7626199.1 Bax inhibitor-1/YccA family protein [Weissella confusa]MBJ7631933.1 Bax inhibitor-1/YccA family protein [Weissella confusa]
MDNFGFEQQEPRLVNPDMQGLNSFFKKVYTYMALALLVTAVTAYLGITMFARQIATIFSSPISSIIMIGVVFGFVYLFGKRVYQNPAQAFGMLMGFAVLNGLMFTVIGMVTPIGTLATAFLTTAFLFAGMALYGVTTKKSMASMSSILFGSLIALIIGGIINLFFFNSIVYMFLSVVGVIVFALFTAYDMNRLKAMYMQFAGDADMEQGMAVSGALSLYMDFINLFIYMIQLFTAFGGSRD